MIKHFVKILELLGDRLEVCVSVYETILTLRSLNRYLSCHKISIIGTVILDPLYQTILFLLERLLTLPNDIIL